MSFLSNFISLNHTLQGAALNSKKRVFESISHMLEAPGDDVITANLIYQKLFDRERIGSTSVGHGVVIPHCRIDNLPITQISVVTLAVPITYDTLDKEPVDIFIGIIFPAEVKNIHHQFLSKLAGLLRNKSFRKELREAKNNEDLYQIMLFAEINNTPDLEEE